MKTGEIVKEGGYKGCRYCGVHGYHGALYSCDQYPQEVIDRIDSALSNGFRIKVIGGPLDGHEAEVRNI